ncbi:MAG: hypothetical protein PHF35_03320 [Candidatus Moranbacteria bacterium]|nr:hypothetical protein [Candidatus Moranbacteria bacterium]
MKQKTKPKKKEDRGIKINFGLAVVAAFAMLAGLVSVGAIAKSDKANANASSSASAKKTTEAASTDGSTTKNSNANANSEKVKVETENRGEDKNISVQTENQAGNSTDEADSAQSGSSKKAVGSGSAADLHRSLAATLMEDLSSVADSVEESGDEAAGKKIRVLAAQQSAAEESAASSIEAVENRSKIKTFLLGSDYENLGQLRSEYVQTRNRIRQLTQLMEGVTDDGAKDLLQEQIRTLTEEQTNMDNFITNEEGKFSLFGWAFRLFGNASVADTESGAAVQ